MTDSEDALARIISDYGGLAEPPTIVRKQVGAPHVEHVAEIRVARGERKPHEVHMLTLPDAYRADELDPLATPLSVDHIKFARKEWFCRVERVTDVAYDNESNTLTIYYEEVVYLFDVWRSL